MIHKVLKVGLVQINNSFSGHSYFPYSVGLLQTYIQAHASHPERYEFMLPIYSRIAVPQALEQLAGADVVGFSTYVWNIRLSLAIAEALKTASPETLIIFGGPQVPDQAESFLAAHPFIDLCCHGEGEAVFMQALECYPQQDWADLAGVSYRQDGQFITRPKTGRIKDMNVVPSPYTSGIFEPLMAAHPETQWLVLWETNRGCPFSCTFCDWGSAVQSKVYAFDLERLYQEVDWFAQQKVEFIFCCDANFGILKRDLEIVEYVAKTKQRSGYPQALSVQNTKNATERAYQVQKILADSGLNKGVTLSLQSVDPQTLKSIKRDNISTESYRELQRRFTRDQIETYSDVILGLPGETYDSFTEGVSQVIENGQHNRIQFNNLAILPNAEMGNPEYQKQYGMRSVETKIINLHGTLLESANEIHETQQLVIATASLPEVDWARTRAFSWITALLHFDKIFQIPLIMLHEMTGLSYRHLLDLFATQDLAAYPTLAYVQQFFLDKARDIQAGGSEYQHGPEWLNIWWPVDEYMFIKLCHENLLDSFYQEAEAMLDQHLQSQDLALPADLLSQAIHLNHALIKLPFQTTNIELAQSYNLWDFYRSIVQGNDLALEQKPMKYLIDRTSQTWNTWDDWCREVVWYGNKKGAYLYSNQVIEPQLSGHY